MCINLGVICGKFVLQVFNVEEMNVDNRNKYISYYVKNGIRGKANAVFNCLYRFTGMRDIFNRREYLGKRFLKSDEANEKITNYIISGKPFMVTRYGGTEMNMLGAYFDKLFLHREEWFQSATVQMCELSGFFPENQELATKFSSYLLDVSKYIDLLGIWNLFMEDYICEQYVQSAEYTKLRNLEPYYAENVDPWSKALAGKKVVVVHPFAESIQIQYKKRKEIWKDKCILPEFELQTIKAVQTLADQDDDRFNNWFEALDYMIEECRKIDFDIAIIGCGAYGMPLAAEIKHMGKGAIHLGGALQILFGIKGKRWDNHPVISQFYNDAWIRPIEQRPDGYKKVEEGCYW